ncbi:disulfide bond formation protein DsbB [Glaciecola sp. 1036]|uniref:disulfide bond formation protein DsbB n=1 Tax=Alteromonadaceae TaxID=72275 RepID=UPI003CFDBB1F
MDWLVTWSKGRQPWFILFLSAFTLICAALYFQHVQGYLPCVKCIYQRTAIVGITLAAALPLIKMHWITRIIGLIGWIYSAIMGLIVANEHLEVIFPKSFLIPPCPIEPEFPSFLPLHHWLPNIFAGPGNCDDNSWQFLSMGMAQWMQIIFSVYLVLGIAVAVTYLIKFRQVAK